MTRLGDLLDFGQLFKAFVEQLFCPNLPHSKAIFVKLSKSLILLVKSFLCKFYRHLATFYRSHCNSQFHLNSTSLKLSEHIIPI